MGNKVTKSNISGSLSGTGEVSGVMRLEALCLGEYLPTFRDVLFLVSHSFVILSSHSLPFIKYSISPSTLFFDCSTLKMETERTFEMTLGTDIRP